MLKFKLRNKDDKIIKVNKIKVDDNFNMQKLYASKFLDILDYEDLLPSGYHTRVQNGHIKYETAAKMAYKLAGESDYYMASKEVAKNHYVVVLIQKQSSIYPNGARYEVYIDYGVEDGEMILGAYDTIEEAKAHRCKHYDPDCTFIYDRLNDRDA